MLLPMVAFFGLNVKRGKGRQAVNVKRKDSPGGEDSER